MQILIWVCTVCRCPKKWDARHKRVNWRPFTSWNNSNISQCITLYLIVLYENRSFLYLSSIVLRRKRKYTVRILNVKTVTSVKTATCGKQKRVPFFSFLHLWPKVFYVCDCIFSHLWHFFTYDIEILHLAFLFSHMWQLLHLWPFFTFKVLTVYVYESLLVNKKVFTNKVTYRLFIYTWKLLFY